MRKLLSAVFLLFASVCAWGQGAAIAFPGVTNPQGQPVPSAVLHFCTTPTVVTSGVCSTPVTVYTDIALTVPYSSAIKTDGLGNFPVIYFTPAANYCYSISGFLAQTNTCYPFSVSIVPGSSPSFTNVLISGTLGVTGATSLSGLTATSFNNVCQASAQIGADAGAKIAACVTAMNAQGGGIIDGRGFVTAQISTINPFVGATVPIKYLFGSHTLTTSACWLLPSNFEMEGMGRGISILKLAAGVNNCYLIQNLDTTNGNSRISIHGMTLDGNALNQTPNEGAGQRTGTIFFQKVTYFWIIDNEIINAYHYHIEAYKGSQFGWIRGNRIDGSINASGILLGTLITPLPETRNEAYDIDASNNWVGNIGGGDCLFATGSNTAGAYGTSRVHFNENTLFNCGDVSIELGDSTRDSEANNNIITVAPSVSVAAVVRAANVVTGTFTCSWVSGIGCLTAFKAGSTFTVAGVTDASFNGTFTVSTVSYATNTLTWAQVAANASSANGTATRSGNLALLSRSGLNHIFKGNVVNGNLIATNQDCELSWHNAGDNAPKDENVEWDDICNNNGRNGFNIIADAAGTVTQIQHKSKMDGTVGSDYVLGANALAVRLNSGGYLTTGNALTGTSFNQSNDITIQPGTASFIHLVTSGNGRVGIGASIFTPTAPLHIQDANGGIQIMLEDTGNNNKTIQWKNLNESWTGGIRAAASACAAESLMFRDTTGGVDAFCISPTTGNAVVLGTLTANGGKSVPVTIASGTASMTTAGITTGACGTTVTVAATGVVTTDVINFTRNAAATIGNGGGLTLNAWPTAGNVNFNYCNSAAGTITPTAMTINWNVLR